MSRIYHNLFLGVALLGAVALPVLLALPAQPLLVLGILLLFAGRRRAAFFFVLSGGLLFETFTPLPVFSFTLALLFSLLLSDSFLMRYFTERTLGGAVFVSVLSALVLEINLFWLSRIFSWLAITGLPPALNLPVLMFVGQRLLTTAGLILIGFITLRRLSAPLRGLVLEHLKNYDRS